VLVQVACALHPPELTVQLSMGRQDCPVPEYPVLHVQVFVPGPVLVQPAFGSQPLSPFAQELIAVQTKPLPE
jgi:hypothetical protein